LRSGGDASLGGVGGWVGSGFLLGFLDKDGVNELAVQFLVVAGAWVSLSPLPGGVERRDRARRDLVALFTLSLGRSVGWGGVGGGDMCCEVSILSRAFSP